MHFLHLGLCWRRKINEINLYARGVVNRKMHLSLIFKNLHPRTKLKSFPLCCSPPPVTKSPTARATEWDFHFLRASLIARWNYVFLNRLMGRQQFPPACRAHCISILISNTWTSIQKKMHRDFKIPAFIERIDFKLGKLCPCRQLAQRQTQQVVMSVHTSQSHALTLTIKESWFHMPALMFSSVAACRTSFVFIGDWSMEHFIIVKLFIGD